MIILWLLIGSLQSWVGASCAEDPSTNSSRNYDDKPGIDGMTSSGKGRWLVTESFDLTMLNPENESGKSFQATPQLYFVPVGSRLSKDEIGRTRRWISSQQYFVSPISGPRKYTAQLADAGVFRVYTSPRKCEVAYPPAGACVWSELPARAFVDGCSGLPRFVVNSGFEPKVFGYASRNGLALLSLVLPDGNTPQDVKVYISGVEYQVSNLVSVDAVVGNRFQEVSRYLGSVNNRNNSMAVVRYQSGFRFGGAAFDLSSRVQSVAGKPGRIKFKLGSKDYDMGFVFEGRWLVDRQTGLEREPKAYLAQLQFGNESYDFGALNAAKKIDGNVDDIRSILHANLIDISPDEVLLPKSEELPDSYHRSFARLDFSGDKKATVRLASGQVYLAVDYGVNLRYWNSKTGFLENMELANCGKFRGLCYKVTDVNSDDIANNGIWVSVQSEDRSQNYLTGEQQSQDMGRQWSVQLIHASDDVTIVKGRWRGFVNDRPFLFRAKIKAEFEQGLLLPKITKRIDSWVPVGTEVLPKGHNATFKLSQSPYIQEIATGVGYTTLTPSEMANSKAKLDVSGFDNSTAIFSVSPPADAVDRRRYNGMFGVRDASGVNKIISSMSFSSSDDVTYVIEGEPSNGSSTDNVVNFGTLTGLNFTDPKASKGEIFAKTLTNAGNYVEMVDLKKWNLGEVYALNGGFFYPNADVNRFKELSILLNGVPKSQVGTGEDGLSALRVKGVFGVGMASPNQLDPSYIAALKYKGRPPIDDVIDVSAARASGAFVYNNANNHNYYRGTVLSLGNSDLCRSVPGNSDVVCSALGTYNAYKSELDWLALEATKNIGSIFSPHIDFAVTMSDASDDWEQGNRVMASVNVVTSVTPYDEVLATAKQLRKVHRAAELNRRIAKATIEEGEKLAKLVAALDAELVDGAMKVNVSNLKQLFGDEFSKEQLADMAEDILLEVGDEAKVSFSLLINKAMGKRKEIHFEKMAKAKGPDWDEYVGKFIKQCGVPCKGLAKLEAHHQVQIEIPGGGYFIADNAWKTADGKWIIDDTKLTMDAPFTDRQKQALQALNDGKSPFTVKSRSRNGLTQGERVEIVYFGRTNGDGLPNSDVFEPEIKWPPVYGPPSPHFE